MPTATGSMTAYDVLGVAETATPEEIQSAFRDLAKQYHPDINKAPDAADAMRRINKAYGILSDSFKRAKYDAWLKNGGRPADSNGHSAQGQGLDMGAMFSWFQTALMGLLQQPVPIKMHDPIDKTIVDGAISPIQAIVNLQQTLEQANRLMRIEIGVASDEECEMEDIDPDDYYEQPKKKKRSKR